MPRSRVGGAVHVGRSLPLLVGGLATTMGCGRIGFDAPSTGASDGGVACAVVYSFDNDPLGAPPAEWTVVSGGGWEVKTTAGSISSRVVSQTLSGPDSGYKIANGDLACTDYSIEARVVQSMNIHCGPFLNARYGDVGNTYGFGLHFTNSYFVVKSVDGVDTTLRTGPFAYTLGSWHTLKLTVAGASLEAFIDGNMVESLTDTTHSAGMISIGSCDPSSFEQVRVTVP